METDPYRREGLGQKLKDSSFAEIQWVQGESRVVSCRSVAPVKILNPGNLSHASMLYLSSYGGGMVEGDQVAIDLSCGEGATAFVGSQANGRIFKQLKEGRTEQVISGKVSRRGLMVICPEPMVLHTQGLFVQRQCWEVEAEGSLLLVDWLQSGRSDSGESFAYQSVESEARITLDGHLVCLDRFRSVPDEDDPKNPARFGGRNLMMNVYVVGPLAAQLKACLVQLSQIDEIPQLLELDRGVKHDYPPVITGFTEVEGENLCILRCLADTREDFSPILEALYEQLQEASLLGFNPLSRKP